MDIGFMPWVLFNLFILILLGLDLGVFNKKNHEIKIKEALAWSGVWISLALLFNLGLYFWQGSEVALTFLAGYLIEKSLSVDNIFVFVMIFSYFNVPLKYQHKILFWGIIGALLMRAGMIFAGTALITNFHWTLYIFGALLLITGIKMGFQNDDDEIDFEKNYFVKMFKKFVPFTKDFKDGKFFVKENGKTLATTLFLVLLIVEASDVIFAVDSIPAIFGVTQEPFIVYTSNVFAILGLRSLYFALAGMADKFHYLKYGLALILSFIGTKMLIVDFYKVPISIALITVFGILILSIVGSIYFPQKEKKEQEPLIKA